MKKETKIIAIIAIIVVIIALFFILSGGGYSKNVQKIRAWQNAFLADDKVTFGEVMDYALINSRWKDIKYEGEDAVELTGTFKKDNKKIRAVFYVDNKQHSDMFAYYEINGSVVTALDLAFDATDYASETAKALGRN